MPLYKRIRFTSDCGSIEVLQKGFGSIQMRPQFSFYPPRMISTGSSTWLLFPAWS